MSIDEQGAAGEVFEVVDRFDNKRVMEHVHLSVASALDWLADIEEHYPATVGKYRVQSVVVYARPGVTS